MSRSPCPKCGYMNMHTRNTCKKCRVNLAEAEKELAARGLDGDVLLTTTYIVQGRDIASYLGVLSAEVVLGSGIFSELGGALADVFGDRASGFQQKLRSAKMMALQELINQCRERGGDGVVGIDLDYNVLGNNMLMVVANGTAVSFAE